MMSAFSNNERRILVKGLDVGFGAKSDEYDMCFPELVRLCGLNVGLLGFDTAWTVELG